MDDAANSNAVNNSNNNNSNFEDGIGGSVIVESSEGNNNNMNNTSSVSLGEEHVDDIQERAGGVSSFSGHRSSVSLVKSIQSKFAQVLMNIAGSAVRLVSTSSSPSPPSQQNLELRDALLGDDVNNNVLDPVADADANSLQATVNIETYALAYAPTTLFWRRVFFCVWAFCTHLMFLYGQTAPMWRLAATADVDVWINATSTVSHATFKSLGLNYTNQILFQGEKEVATFTYGFGITSLWKADGIDSKFLSRVCAVLLILASGVWPHLKLLLLEACWFLPVYEKTRTKQLYWLGALGKWTLADVFVVCVMVGIVNLNWVIDPVAIKGGIAAQLPTAVRVAKQMYTTEEVCTEFLSMDCSNHLSVKHQMECYTCETAVQQAYNHPKWAKGAGKEFLKGIETSGGGLAEMRVAGMRGIYAYCAAVIMSLLLGVFVDVLDHKSRLWTSNRRQQAYLSASSISTTTRNTYSSLGSRSADCTVMRRRVPECSRALYIIFVLVACVTAFVVALAATDPSMERSVRGAFPQMLEDVLGMEWSQEYSLTTLGRVTGDAGGWDHMLMATFMIFMVLGPIVRGVLCVIYLILPLTESAHQKLLAAINFVGSFCAWEVFTAAVFMVHLEIQSTTNTIINRPECVHLAADGSCLEVEFDMTKSYGLVLFGGLMLAIVSILSVKLGFLGLDPYSDGDTGGPYIECCDEEDHTYDYDLQRGNVQPLEHSFYALNRYSLALNEDMDRCENNTQL